MSTRKVKKIMIAFLAVMMLVVSSALLASAKTNSKTYTVQSGSFRANISSETNGVSPIIVMSSFTATNQTTGVSANVSKGSPASNLVYGYLNSLTYQGTTIRNVPKVIACHVWSSGVDCRYAFYAY